MAKTVKVPDPVYDEAKKQAEREDVSMGAIIREWMKKVSE